MENGCVHVCVKVWDVYTYVYMSLHKKVCLCTCLCEGVVVRIYRVTQPFPLAEIPAGARAYQTGSFSFCSAEVRDELQEREGPLELT